MADFRKKVAKIVNTTLEEEVIVYKGHCSPLLLLGVFLFKEKISTEPVRQRDNLFLGGK